MSDVLMRTPRQSDAADSQQAVNPKAVGVWQDTVRLTRELAIDLTTVPDDSHENPSGRVIDLINHAVVADPDAIAA